MPYNDEAIRQRLAALADPKCSECYGEGVICIVSNPSKEEHIACKCVGKQDEREED